MKLTDRQLRIIDSQGITKMPDKSTESKKTKVTADSPWLDKMSDEFRRDWAAAGKRNLKVYEHRGVNWFTEDDAKQMKEQIKKIKDSGVF